jgi:hypothetical protein
MFDSNRLKYFQYDTQMSENFKLQSTISGMHYKSYFTKTCLSFCITHGPTQN